MLHYLKQLLIAMDQMLNAVLGGWADETISSRCYRVQSPFRYIIDALFFWQEEHCKQCYEYERERMGLPVEYRYQRRKKR